MGTYYLATVATQKNLACPCCGAENVAKIEVQVREDTGILSALAGIDSKAVARTKAEAGMKALLAEIGTGSLEVFKRPHGVRYQCKCGFVSRAVHSKTYSTLKLVSLIGIIFFLIGIPIWIFSTLWYAFAILKTNRMLNAAQKRKSAAAR